jgi:enoyl-CoA hydratase/carnithine racemase
MTEALRIDKDGPIVRLILNRPDAGNRINASVIRAIQDACEAIRDDAGVRAVVFAADGDCFSAGWDWQGLADDSGRVTASSLRMAGALDDPFGCLSALPQPVIAALRGGVSGGGLALALAADIRVAADDAEFSAPEVENGLVPMGGTTQRLVRAVGRSNALAMILAGESVTADEALRMGLVSEVVSGSDLNARASALAGRIAERGPVAIQYAKEALHRGAEMPLEQALRYETDLTVILQTTEDRAAGVEAFVKKDAPEFKGR